MLLITERVIQTGGPLQREDPAPHGNPTQVPELYAGDVRSSQFLFIFQESELPQLDAELEKKTANARAADKHIFSYVRNNQRPEKDWKAADFRFPVLRGNELFVRIYHSEKQPVNLVAVTNIPINELIKNPLKTGGESIGNHSLKRFYDEVMTYMERYIENLGTSTSDPKQLSIVLARLRANWEAFVIANKGNDYFNPRNAENALQTLALLEKRTGIEVSVIKDQPKRFAQWVKIAVAVITLIASIVAILEYLFPRNSASDINIAGNVHGQTVNIGTTIAEQTNIYEKQNDPTWTNPRTQSLQGLSGKELIERWFELMNEGEWQDACSLMSRDKCNSDNGDDVLEHSREPRLKAVDGYQDISVWHSKSAPADTWCVKYSHQERQSQVLRDIVLIMQYKLSQRDDGGEDIASRLCEKNWMSGLGDRSCSYPASVKYCL